MDTSSFALYINNLLTLLFVHTLESRESRGFIIFLHIYQILIFSRLRNNDRWCRNQRQRLRFSGVRSPCSSRRTGECFGYSGFRKRLDRRRIHRRFVGSDRKPPCLPLRKTRVMFFSSTLISYICVVKMLAFW